MQVAPPRWLGSVQGLEQTSCRWRLSSGTLLGPGPLRVHLGLCHQPGRSGVAGRAGRRRAHPLPGMERATRPSGESARETPTARTILHSQRNHYSTCKTGSRGYSTAHGQQSRPNETSDVRTGERPVSIVFRDKAQRLRPPGAARREPRASMPTNGPGQACATARRYAFVLLLAVNVLNLADFLLTLNVLAHGGGEANPILRSLFALRPDLRRRVQDRGGAADELARVAVPPLPKRAGGGGHHAGRLRRGHLLPHLRAGRLHLGGTSCAAHAAPAHCGPLRPVRRAVLPR